jgi:hypothetical protein
MWAEIRRFALALEIVVLFAGLYRVSQPDPYSRFDQSLAIAYLVSLILLPIYAGAISWKSMSCALACFVASCVCLASAIFCYIIALHLPNIDDFMRHMSIRREPFSSYFVWLSVMTCFIGLPSFVIVWIHFAWIVSSGASCSSRLGKLE